MQAGATGDIVILCSVCTRFETAKRGALARGNTLAYRHCERARLIHARRAHTLRSVGK